MKSNAAMSNILGQDVNSSCSDGLFLVPKRRVARSHVRTDPSAKIRMGNVSYLNSVPYQAFSDLPWVNYSEHNPADCATLLADAEIDLGLVPVAECFRHGGYGMLEWGIVSRGAVQSVLLLSRCALDDLETVFIDPASHSSVALLKVLLAAHSDSLYRRIRFVKCGLDEIKGNLGERNGVLVIGDRALQMQRNLPNRFEGVESADLTSLDGDSLDCNCVDLGQWWYNETGYPFVFAAWAGRTNFLTTSQRRSLETVLRNSLEQRELNARKWARERGRDEDVAAKYITERVFHFIDHASFQGMEEFLWRGISLGLFPPSVARRGLRLESLAAVSLLPKRAPIIDEQVLGHYLNTGARLSIRDGLEIADTLSLTQLRQLCEDKFSHDEDCPDSHLSSTLKLNQESDLEGLTAQLEVSTHLELAIPRLAESRLSRIETLLRRIKEINPLVQISGFSASEIIKISVKNHVSREQTIVRLQKAGLGILGSAGVSLLINPLRSRTPWVDLTSEQWMEIHCLAHRLGMRSIAGVNCGFGESWDDRIVHLNKIRQVQDETSGFIRFDFKWAVGCDVESLSNRSSRDSEFERFELVARVFLDNFQQVGGYKSAEEDQVQPKNVFAHVLSV